MEQTATETRPVPAPPIERVPEFVRSQLDGEASSIVAWSLFDLTDDGKLGSRHLILTEQNLIVLESGQKRSIPVHELTAAKVVEGLGVDRLVVVAGEQVKGEFPYSRHCRREMTRLHRKLERKLPGEDGKPKERPPDWLDVAERQTEAKEYCHKCGQLIPSYAEGVCPECLHKRSILLRLIGQLKPYKGRFIFAVCMMLISVSLNALPPLVTRATIDNALNAQTETSVRLISSSSGAGPRWPWSPPLRSCMGCTCASCPTSARWSHVICAMPSTAHLHDLSPALFRQAPHGLADHARDQRHGPSVGLHRLRLGEPGPRCADDLRAARA